MTLTEFLLARIAEDEVVARAAFSEGRLNGRPREDDGRWHAGNHDSDAERVDGIGITIYDEGGHNAEQAQHIARHDPARVLADCEAKRRIVERLRTHQRESYFEAAALGTLVIQPDGGVKPAPLPERTTLAGERIGLEFAVRALALPYADHPEFRSEWRP